jgi:hypothetical protein
MDRVNAVLMLRHGHEDRNRSGANDLLQVGTVGGGARKPVEQVDIAHVVDVGSLIDEVDEH